MPLIGPLIGAAVTIGGGLLASGSQSRAADRATQAQTASDAAAIAENRRQFDVTQGNLAPWLTAGKTALGEQGDLLGLAGADAQQGSIDALMQSPLYQSLFRNGQNTILANESATGGLRGGDIQNSLANFGSDTLAQVIQTQLANLGGISGQGRDTAATLGGLGAQNAGAIGGIMQSTGAAQAGGALAKGAIGANNINNIVQSLGGIAGNTSIQTALGKLF
jgi:hypothetical protein